MSFDLAQRPQDDGPSAVVWQDYVTRLKRAYDELLKGDPDEAAVQSFFEKHPSLLPGAFPNAIGHGAFPEALISQPELNGIGRRRPDFLWLARSSAMIQPVFIEIERPGKTWFANKGHDLQPSAVFTQAINQLTQWSTWLDQPANVEVMLETFGVPAEWRRQRPVRPQLTLIYGRRSENAQAIAEHRRFYADRGITVLTYDNLRANPWCSDYITVRGLGLGRFRAIQVPPTVSWSASSPESWRIVEQREEAVHASALPPERKAALISQIPKWDAWADAWLELRGE